MKKTFRFALIAATVCGLSLAATSCKDDDNSDNGNNGGGTEAVDDQTSLEEYQLQSMMANFAGIDASDVVLTKTYEPEIGVVDDASKPNVRSIAVGTVEKADETAVMLLSSLGIDATSPVGFSYSSDMVGTVSYQHGGGDANTLATINLALKQMPGLVQLRLTKTAGENANTLPRYKVGDVVKYKNHYWVCVFEAGGYKGNAYFVTFDHTGNLHKTSTFTWTPSWSDKYWQYSTPMADATTLSQWLINCVLNDDSWQKVKSNYNYAMGHKEGYQWRSEDLEQMVPTSIDQRKEFINKIYKANPNTDTDFVTYMVSKSQTNLSYANDDADVWEDYDGGKGHLKAPTELLCNTTRYSENVLSNNQYWVSYLFLCPKSKATAFDNHLKAIPSQNTKKFTHEILQPSYSFNSPALRDSLGTNEVAIMTAARYWEHEYFDGKNWLLFDFTKDWRNSDGSSYTVNDMWISRCVTSKSMSIVDKGVTASGFTDVYVAREDELNNNDEGYDHGLYQPGDVLQDEMGAKWMCIFGAACDNMFGFRDKTAWFVSFDGIQQGNIVKERDLMEMAHRFTFGVYHSMTDRDDSYGFKGAGQLGQWKTAYDYAGIDMSKMWVHRDTTWTFTADGKTYNSKADKNLMTNILYLGDDGTLKLLRCIADNSQGGSERTAAKGPSGKPYDTPKMRFYKHYETFDTSKMEALNDDEKALSMTMWMKPWAITNKEMHFSDLSNQDIVDKYAANDKWVTLPLHGTTERQKPKTNANSSALGRGQYEYDTKTKDFYTPGLTGIFKEPVLIMRLMKVTDNGGTTPNLTAQDGTKLTVVKLVENPYLYDNNLVPMINYMLRNNYQQSLIFLDNKPYQSDYKF